MKFKALATSAIVASASLSPISPLVTAAHADSGDVVAGLIIGGILGAAVNESANQKKAQKRATTKSKSSKSTKTTSKPAVSTAQRNANVEVQKSLNYFGWNVGGADGALGAKSRAAISQYQVFMGYAPTGQLTEVERNILVTAHTRANAGGAAVAEIVTTSPYGMRGLLTAQRDEMTGTANPMTATGFGMPAPGSVAAATAAAIPAMTAPAAPAAPITANPEPVAELLATAPAVVPAAPALPSFMGANGANGALSAECNRVSLTANTRGGYLTAANMTDANAALAEQFCLTRTAAIASGHELSARVAGVAPTEIAAQCAAFGPVLEDQVAALSMRPAAEVLAGVEGFILNSGMSPAQLSGTAKVCLGVGYDTDNMDVAIGSALLLTAMGETGYAEALGHHLSQGFGATQRNDLATGWYEIGLKSMDGGKDVFVPGMNGRQDLVRKAALTLAGRGAELAAPATVQEAALPSFDLVPAVPEATVAPEAPAAAPAPAATPEALPIVMPPAAVPATPEAVEKEASVVPEATVPTSPAAGMMRAGAEAAMVAARLPLLVIGGN